MMNWSVVYTALIWDTYSVAKACSPKYPMQAKLHDKTHGLLPCRAFGLSLVANVSHHDNKNAWVRHANCIRSALMALLGCLHGEINPVMIYLSPQNKLSSAF
jgi:hypothetical protein